MKKFIKSSLIIILTLILLIQQQITVEASKTVEELQEELDAFRSERDQAESDMISTQAQQELAMAILEDVEQSMVSLEADILTLDLEIDDLRVRQSEKEDEIVEQQALLDEAMKEEAAYHDQVAERMKVMYEYGDVSFIQVLFESENLSELFTRLEYISKIFSYDEKMFDQLEEMQRSITAQEALLEVSSFELDSILEDTEDKKTEASALYETKGIMKAMIEDAKELLALKEAELEAEEERINAEIEATMEAIEAAKLRWINGVLYWPTPGYTRITSPFGFRTHPIHGTVRMHNGIDIAVPYGAEIVAADDGKVISAYYSSSYGNVITIYHGTDDNGQGIFTLYAHNSKLLVSKDDTVTRGETIAYAGSTGWSTGPHLHFGVKKDTEWVNPLDYFNVN